jgi:hypothetical protein
VRLFGRKRENGGDELELTPPGESEVAGRALCLAAHAALGSAAHDLSTGAAAPQDVDSFAKELREWLGSEGAGRHQSTRERDAFRRPLGAWSDRDLIDAGWRTESLGVMLWALSVYDDLPPYDAQFEDVPDHVPLLGPAARFLEETSLRPADEIARARDLAELWHWRSRTTQLQADDDFKSSHPELELDEIVRETARAAREAGDIPEPIDQDFPAFGKPYRDLSTEEYEEATSIAMERHFALNWLCGYSRDWDETPTDT